MPWTCVICDASCSCRWLTLTTGHALPVPWWRFVLTGRTARRRVLWSWLHRTGLRSKAEWTRQLVCFYRCDCSMCISLTLVPFPHLYVPILSKRRPRFYDIFCICSPVNANCRLMGKLLSPTDLSTLNLFVERLKVMCCLSEPTLYTKWQSYSLMKMCVLLQRFALL